jgi:arginine decarboxylase
MLNGESLRDSGRVVIGNRVPFEFFIVKGTGESDIAVHAGSYHLALKSAGIEAYNIITYSSILPKIAKEIPKPDHLEHGSVMETIMAVGHFDKNVRGTAGIIFGWLHDKKTNEKYGGLVCEYSGSISEDEMGKQLNASLQELYTNGFSEKFDLKNVQLVVNSVTSRKKHGTVLVALCFVSYIYPILKND